MILLHIKYIHTITVHGLALYFILVCNLFLYHPMYSFKKIIELKSVIKLQEKTKEEKKNKKMEQHGKQMSGTKDNN